MRVKQIRIRGFKSLEDVIFEPETGFSCLVGANGAGKSNFCDALLFFKRIILNGVEDTLNNFINKDLINHENSDVALDFIIENAGEVVAEYYLVVDLTNNIIKEEIIKRSGIFLYEKKGEQSKKLDINKFEESANEFSLRFNFLKKMTKEIENDDLNKNQVILDKLNDLDNHVFISTWKGVPESLIESDGGQKLSGDKAALSSYFEGLGLFELFSRLNVFRINPLAPKSPTKIFNKSNLLIYGENLATILAELKKDENKWQTLHEWLSLIVPSISEVQVNQGEFDESLSLHFKENKHLLPAICISDGTIYTIAILTAVLWNQGKDTLIVIEEPERGIHPQALSELINFMRDATQDKLNIIVTTHSETFVRNCKLEELWLVDKNEGRTKLKSAKKENLHLTETSLDEAWLMNLFNGGLPW